MRQTATERRNWLSVAACQPITTPHHQPCHLSPHPTWVPPRLNLFTSTSSFHYVPHKRKDKSAFISFNYPLCQSSPSYRASTLYCLTPPPTPSILQQLFTLLQLVGNNHPSFFFSHLIVCWCFFVSFLRYGACPTQVPAERGSWSYRCFTLQL